MPISIQGHQDTRVCEGQGEQPRLGSGNEEEGSRRQTARIVSNGGVCQGTPRKTNKEGDNDMNHWPMGLNQQQAAEPQPRVNTNQVMEDPQPGPEEDQSGMAWSPRKISGTKRALEVLLEAETSSEEDMEEWEGTPKAGDEAQHDRVSPNSQLGQKVAMTEGDRVSNEREANEGRKEKENGEGEAVDFSGEKGTETPEERWCANGRKTKEVGQEVPAAEEEDWAAEGECIATGEEATAAGREDLMAEEEELMASREVRSKGGEDFAVGEEAVGSDMATEGERCSATGELPPNHTNPKITQVSKHAKTQHNPEKGPERKASLSTREPTSFIPETQLTPYTGYKGKIGYKEIMASIGLDSPTSSFECTNERDSPHRAPNSQLDNTPIRNSAASLMALGQQALSPGQSRIWESQHQPSLERIGNEEHTLIPRGELNGEWVRFNLAPWRSPTTTPRRQNIGRQLEFTGKSPLGHHQPHARHEVKPPNS